MMRPAFLYLVNWFLIFVISTRSVEVIKRRVNEGALPDWFRGKRASALAYFGGIVAFGSSISSVIFGIFLLKWYIWPLAIFGGIALAGMSFRNFSPASVVAFWPPFLILVQVVLWLFSSR